MDLTFNTPIGAQRQIDEDTTLSVQHHAPTWSFFPGGNTLDDTLPSPPSSTGRYDIQPPPPPTSSGHMLDNEPPFNLFDSHGAPGPTQRTSTAELPGSHVTTRLPLPPPPLAATSTPLSSKSPQRTQLPTLTATETVTQPGGSLDKENAHGNRSSRRGEEPSSHTGRCTSLMGGHVTPTQISTRVTCAESRTAHASQGGSDAQPLGLSPSAHASLGEDGVAVLDAMQRRCADLTHQVEALEVRARQREGQHTRALENQREAAEHTLTRLQHTLAHTESELANARAQHLTLQEEMRRQTAERRQQREQIARLERQHQQDAAKLAALTSAHAKEVQSLRSDVQRLREERDGIRQQYKEQRDVAKKQATHHGGNAVASSIDSSSQTELDACRRACHLAEERALLAEQAFDALRGAWLAAMSRSGSSPGSACALPETAHPRAMPLHDASPACTGLSEEALCAQLRRLSSDGARAVHAEEAPNRDATDAARTVATRSPPPVHLSNGASLRLVQYRDAIKELDHQHKETHRQRDVMLVDAVKSALAQLEANWAAHTALMTNQLERAAHRVEGLVSRLASYRGLHVEQQQRRDDHDARDADLRAALTATAAHLEDVQHENRLLQMQLQGIAVAEQTRVAEPARLVAIMAQATESVRTARLSLSRTMDEALARVQQVASAEVGKSLTDSFLVVVQTTAVKAEAQMELLARQLLKCGAATNAATSESGDAKRKHVSFSAVEAYTDHPHASAAGSAAVALTSSIPIGADGFPISLTTAHQREVYREMQRLLRAPPSSLPPSSSTATRGTAGGEMALQLLSTCAEPLSTYDRFPNEDYARADQTVCHAHHSELSALQHMSRQLRNMSVLLDNHKSQAAQQHARIASILQDAHATMESSMDCVTSTLAALLAEAAETQSLADCAEGYQHRDPSLTPPAITTMTTASRGAVKTSMSLAAASAAARTASNTCLLPPAPRRDDGLDATNYPASRAPHATHPSSYPSRSCGAAPLTCQRQRQPLEQPDQRRLTADTPSPLPPSTRTHDVDFGLTRSPRQSTTPGHPHRSPSDIHVLSVLTSSGPPPRRTQDSVTGESAQGEVLTPIGWPCAIDDRRVGAALETVSPLAQRTWSPRPNGVVDSLQAALEGDAPRLGQSHTRTPPVSELSGAIRFRHATGTP